MRHSIPLMFPLNSDGTLYAMRDESGKTIGTGTREVCELLVHIINQRTNQSLPEEVTTQTRPRVNLRAAIVI